MSAAEIAEQPATRSLTLLVALRNTLLTLSLTIVTLALTGIIWREQGYEMLIVTMGWPHVILGFAFYFGRVMRGEANARTSLVFLLFLTLALWVIHYNYAVTGLIYLYFLYHAFRDEIFVFLQTRARHRGNTNVYAITGVGPLILLMLLIPQQNSFRHDLRRAEFTGAQIRSDANGTLISFKPVPNSSGRDFYFYLEAPHTTGLRAFITNATATDSRADGRALVGDRDWPQAADLVFRPHYSDQPASEGEPQQAGGDIPVLLTGGHRVGQTFRAGRNNLDGIWLPISRIQDASETTRFAFHLASPPMLPHPAWLANLRFLLLVFLGLVVLWKLVPRSGRRNYLWICLLVLLAGLFGTQTVLKSANNAGYAFPLIFQFVVVFHYWSWYVFSFDKLCTMKSAVVRPAVSTRRYDRLLGWLRSTPNFTTSVIILNVISGLAVLSYYKLGGPATLRFGFDYNYFLYFLVFHVTFSFKLDHFTDVLRSRLFNRTAA